MKKLVMLMLVALTTAGCASMRGVNVGSEPNNNFSLDVTNSRSAAVTFSYVDGEGAARQLGSVPAGRTERFVIVASSPTVSVTARNSAGTSVGTFTVSTTAGTQRITVR